MDGKAGKPVLKDAEAQSFLRRFSAKMQETQMKRQQAMMKKQDEENKITYKNNIAQGDSFLAEK